MHARDAWWHEKHHRAEVARPSRPRTRAEAAHGGIHLPDQSWYPLIAGLGLLVGGLAFAR